MAKKPPIDLQAALEAAKAKLAQPPQYKTPQRHSVPRSIQGAIPQTADPKLVVSREEGSLTLEKLAKAWAQSKNFPKTH